MSSVVEFDSRLGIAEINGNLPFLKCVQSLTTLLMITRQSISEASLLIFRVQKLTFNSRFRIQF